MSKGKEVRIELEDGPVSVESNKGSGIDKSYSLGNDIEFSESFPKGVELANYLLIFKKIAESVDQVDNIREELCDAALQICLIWPFADGARINYDRVIENRETKVRDNAEEVKSEFLKEQGKRIGTATFTLNGCISGTYRDFPGAKASALYAAVQMDPDLRQMLTLYYDAHDKPSTWYDELYKVRDILSEHFGGSIAAKTMLSISNSDWSEFGRITNIDGRRHVGAVKGSNSTPSPGDRDRVMRLSADWINKYIQHKKYIK